MNFVKLNKNFALNTDATDSKIVIAVQIDKATLKTMVVTPIGAVESDDNFQDTLDLLSGKLIVSKSMLVK